MSGLKGRSDPSVGTMTELPSWMPMGTSSSSAASHTHVVGAVGQRAPEAGVGPDEAGDEAELGHGPPQLARRRRRVLQRAAWPPRRAGAGRRRSSRPASRCRRRPARPPPPGPRPTEKYSPIVGYSTAWSMPSASMSRRRATGSEPPGSASASGRKEAGSSKVEPGRARLPERHGQDLGVADHDVLVARRVRA